MAQEHVRYPLARIGIVGGGQLGKMMTQKAKKMGFYVTILDPTPHSPAGQVADRQIVGDFYAESKLQELVETSDVTTYDIEHIDVQVLKRLYDEGHRIHPSPYVLEIIQDKLAQKDLLANKGLPVPQYLKVDSPACLERLGFPVVQKARKGGYDGRGVVVLKGKEDIAQAIRTESFIEVFIEYDKELAVMVARSLTGEMKCYPVVEMVFEAAANICDMVIAPARIEKEIEEQAKKVAVGAVEALNGVGILGVEMFLANGSVLINEIAPRPHNSGHYTIEACVTCQFEQHIRAISGLPLGETTLLSPAVMVNLLGSEGYAGPPLLEGLREALSIPGLSFHFYGKRETRPFRKMGHVTILDENLDRAIEKAQRTRALLKVKAG